MAKKDYSAITPEVLKLSELCAQNSVINSDLFVEHKVYRGLRDLNGNGVLQVLQRFRRYSHLALMKTVIKFPVPESFITEDLIYKSLSADL